MSLWGCLLQIPLLYLSFGEMSQSPAQLVCISRVLSIAGSPVSRAVFSVLMCQVFYSFLLKACDR